MRSRGVRLDLFICMIIVGAIFVGIFTVTEKLGVLDTAFDVIGTLVDGSKKVADGEVGGKATPKTPRASSMEDVVKLSQQGKAFTIETGSVNYYNYGTFVGDNYEWRILEIDDDNAMAVRLNTNNIQDGDSVYTEILPVGRVVFEAPGALEEMQEAIRGEDIAFVTNAYIDMDGKANATYINPMMQSTMILVTLAGPIFGLLAFILYILAVLGVHAIFVKLGLFPPVFTPKSGKK